MKSFEIEKLREQDPEVLSSLFADLAPRLSKFVRNLYRAEEHALDTDDIVMEVFSQLLRDPEKLADLAASEKLETWCQQLARNITVHHFRRAEKTFLRESVSDIEMSESADPAKLYETAEIVKALLERLSDSQRQLITMHYVEGLSYEEIALRLNGNPLWIKTQL